MFFWLLLGFILLIVIIAAEADTKSELRGEKAAAFWKSFVTFSVFGLIAFAIVFTVVTLIIRTVCPPETKEISSVSYILDKKAQVYTNSHGTVRFTYLDADNKSQQLEIDSILTSYPQNTIPTKATVITEETSYPMLLPWALEERFIVHLR